METTTICKWMNLVYKYYKVQQSCTSGCTLGRKLILSSCRHLSLSSTASLHWLSSTGICPCSSDFRWYSACRRSCSDSCFWVSNDCHVLNSPGEKRQWSQFSHDHIVQFSDPNFHFSFLKTENFKDAKADDSNNWKLGNTWDIVGVLNWL